MGFTLVNVTNYLVPDIQMIIYYQLDIVKPLEFTIGTSLFVSIIKLGIIDPSNEMYMRFLYRQIFCKLCIGSINLILREFIVIHLS